MVVWPQSMGIRQVNLKPAIAIAAIMIVLLQLCPRPAAADGNALGTDALETHNNHTIVLLHGMGRGRASLWVLDTRLQRAGYRTLNFTYAAHSYPIEEMAKQLIAFIEDNVETDTYHLIAHSLGNLILRSGFAIGYPEGLGRIVMLAPPNRPTELARALRDNPIYKWFTSESGWQSTSDAFYETLPVPTVEFGIIAGKRGQAVMLQEPNDGVITVESTKLEGMTDWTVVPHAHTFIMNSRDVAALCISFIKTGRFTPPDEENEDYETSPCDTTVVEKE